MNTAWMGVATIALLGPLAIDGDATALAPRDRVVLSALALHGSEVSSVERLADALWGPAPPASWPKVVPGCVHRLRRALGANAIETTPYGYRLAVEDDDIDTRRFEHLLHRGRELLALGDADRAAYTLGEAVGLWRGGAYLDLDGWEPGRIEAARLGELRLEAQESRIEAALQGGRHADALAPAQSAVAEAPLRERRWGLLALAQYRCGRQGEALQTLRRARQMLVTELGLDPGPELVALETAILRQDPSLTVAPPEPASGECPYLGLVGYDIDDAENFFGREWEIADCVSRLTAAGVLAVVGPSGCGKSSLVRAGVGAALGRSGCRSVVMTPGPHPMAAIADLETVGVALIVDQFEEVFINCSDADERQRFCADITARAVWCRVVISLRADRMGELAAYPELARMVERGLYLLGPMDADALRSAITGPADRAGLLLEPGLVDLLVREVEGEPGALPLLSHALRQTWERRAGRTLTVAAYQEVGGIRGCVARSAENLYETLTEPQRDLLRRIMLRLVSTTNDGDPIRTRVPQRLLLGDPDRERMVDRLVQARLVTTDRDTVQIAHESVARAWPRLISWLDEDVEGQRILRHLSAAADGWQSMGRPDGELYRGGRLAQVLDWRQAADPTLTSIESDFIAAGVAARDADQRATAERARQRARTRRRNRLVIVGVAAVLVAALVAGLLAVRQQQQRQEADLAAQIAEAGRVDDAARGAADVDTGLLLALEANRIHESPETRTVLADLLSDHPALIRSLVARDVVRTLAVSPDGATLIVGESETGTSIHRTDTLERTAATAVNGWSIEYRADGQQLLLAGKGSEGLDEGADDLTAAVSDPRLSARQRLVFNDTAGFWLYADDVAYSGDGRWIAVYAEGSDQHGGLVDGHLLIWDALAPGESPAVVGSMPSLAVALNPDGRLLYVLTQQPALAVIDVSTGGIVNSHALPPGLVPLPTFDINAAELGGDLSDDLEISPDGSTVAVAVGNDVVLLDSMTLTERLRMRGVHGRVLSVQFSPDGRQLATGSADGTAVMWDVASGSEVQRLAGHGGAVLALAFSPAGDTLYTGGTDHRVLVWDLAGRRRFVAMVSDADPPRADIAVPSPDGHGIVFVGSPTKNGSLQFLDVATGVLDPPVADPYGDAIAVWLPPEHRTVVTAARSTLRVWDRSRRAIIAERMIGGGEVTALATTPDGRLLLAGDQAGVLHRVDPGSLEPVGAPVRLDHPITAIAATPDARAVAMLDDMSYALVDLNDGGVRREGDLGIKPVAAAVSPDGARLAVGGSHGDVGLLDLSSSEWIAAPRATHGLYVLGLGFSSDGGTFVSSAFDGSVGIWNGLSGEPIADAPIGQKTPAVATMLADGHSALVATRDGPAYRIGIGFDTWIGHACAVAGRNLSAVEWSAVFGDRPHHDTCPVG